MAAMIEIQEPGDFVWTTNEGELRCWRVQKDGGMREVPREVIPVVLNDGDRIGVPE